MQLNKEKSFSLVSLNFILLIVCLTWIEGLFGAFPVINNIPPILNMTFFPTIINILGICFLLIAIQDRNQIRNILCSYQNQITALLKSSSKSKECYFSYKESAECLVSSLNTLSEIVCLYDRLKHKVLFINNPVMEILGYSPDEIKELDSFLDLLTAENYENIQKQISSAEQHFSVLNNNYNPIYLSGEFKQKSGSTVLLAVEIRAIIEKEVLSKLLIKFREKLHKEKPSIIPIAPPTSSENCKSQLLSNIIHELRTPLIEILASVDLLQSSYLNQEQSEHAQTIKKCSEHLVHVISQILDVSGLDLGLIEIHNDCSNFKALLDTATSRFQPALLNKDISLYINIQPDIPEILFLDEAKLDHILSNLLENAIKYTDSGKIVINAHMKDMILSVTISDTGIGIPQNKLDYIFDCFTQLDNSNCRKFRGTGTGLYLCKKYVELMAGEIYAESTVGKGTIFTVKIPVQSKSEMHKTETYTTQSYEGPAEARFNSMSVLLVEDTELNKRLLVQLLINNGFNVSTADNGYDCLQLLDKKQFDIILMDMQMPIMDGYEATRKIRENRKWTDIPIIAITANAMTGDREKCLNSGCNSYLAKPFKSEDLIQEINQLVNFKNSSANSFEPDQLIRELMPEFLEMLDEMLRELNEAVEMKKIDTVKHIAHSIKGTAGIYGFHEISELAAVIEHAAINTNYAQLNSLSAKLIYVYQELEESCSTLVAT